jgi:hypothetical protein
MDSRAQRDSTPPERARDAGLRRASTLTKWIGVGAVALVGALAGFVAQAKPGRSTSSAQPSGANAGSLDNSSQPGGSNSGAASGANGSAPPSLAAPSAPPAPAPSPPVTLSGGS